MLLDVLRGEETFVCRYERSSRKQITVIIFMVHRFIATICVFASFCVQTAQVKDTLKPNEDVCSFGVVSSILVTHSRPWGTTIAVLNIVCDMHYRLHYRIENDQVMLINGRRIIYICISYVICLTSYYILAYNIRQVKIKSFVIYYIVLYNNYTLANIITLLLSSSHFTRSLI